MREPRFYKHALALGCGGGAVPRWMLEEYPSLQVDVVDRSPEIIAICKKYFLHEWEGSPRLKYFCTDAQDFEPADYQYQFIFCDLFNGKSLAPVVYSNSFAEKMRRITCDDGILVINCGWNHLDEVKKIYRNHFKKLQEITREPWQTEVVVASGRIS